MMVSCRLAFRKTLAAFASLAVLSGILVACSQLTVLPPLRIEGAVVDVEGNPLSDREVQLVLPFIDQIDAAANAVKAALSGNISSDNKDYLSARVRTNADGRFVQTFPETARVTIPRWGSWFPIVGDSDADRRQLVFLVAHDGAAYLVRAKGMQRKTALLGTSLEDLQPLPDVGGKKAISVRIDRGRKCDKAKLLIVSPHAKGLSDLK